MGPKEIFYCRSINLNRYDHIWTLLSIRYPFFSKHQLQALNWLA